MQKSFRICLTDPWAGTMIQCFQIPKQFDLIHQNNIWQIIAMSNANPQWIIPSRAWWNMHSFWCDNCKHTAQTIFTRKTTQLWPILGTKLSPKFYFKRRSYTVNSRMQTFSVGDPQYIKCIPEVRSENFKQAGVYAQIETEQDSTFIQKFL